MTVADLIVVWNIKAGGYRDSLPNADSDKIKLLNAAKHKIWQHLVAASRANYNNWFTKNTTVVVTPTARNLDLPTDFHDCSFVESLSTGWEEVNFEGVPFYKDTFRQNRRTAGSAAVTDGTRFYVIAGDNPSQILVDRFLPTVTLTVWYTAVLAEWTATTSPIDKILTPYQDAVVNLACYMNALSRHDAQITELYKAAWEEDKALMLGVAGLRQTASLVKPQPYDNVA